MLIDCHTHTARHSACSMLEPERLCELALQRGLDALVITEHHHQWSDTELDPLARRFPELRLFSGMEVTVREGYDVVVVGERLEGLGQRLTPVRNLVNAVADRRDDVFLFVAHPFRFSKYFGGKLKRVLDVVDGIEMSSVNIMRGEHVIVNGRYSPNDDDLYARALKGRGLTPVYNTDAHSPDAVGTIMSRYEGEPPEDVAALARMLKSQHPEEVQNARLLGTCLSGWRF
ncbi:MAG: PHP domain-containing protein [Oceanidesulfovibrio sp.]